ncbi:LysR family transcriptional regulator [Lysobacter sp. TAF61]|uniref:LysR family transcriptional regulator n=1 Tax=Lysobacter sp. TAF61 TaxID=3233072 RepID=UPI003F94C0A0
MVDLNDVALFVQVVKAGSFAEAARRAGMPSNTVSRRIGQLEEQLGVRLLHRSTRHLTLTDAGEALFARSSGQVEALSEAALDVGEGGLTPRGKVRVAAAADFFHWFELDWVKLFLTEYPLVRLEFVLSDARADLVAEGIDVAIRAGAINEPTLIARRIGSNRGLMVASPGYLAERGVPESLADLAGHDCISGRDGPGRTAWHLDGANGPTEVVVRGRFFANSALAQLRACTSGVGIALLPDVMCAPYLLDGQLVPVLPEFGVDGLDMYLVYQSRRQVPRAVSAFVEFALAKMVTAGLVRAGANPIVATSGP